MMKRNFSRNTIRWDLLKRENIKEMAEFRAAKSEKFNGGGLRSSVFEEGNGWDSDYDQ